MWFLWRGSCSKREHLRRRLLLVTRNRCLSEWFQCSSKHGKMQETGFIKFSPKNVCLQACPASFARAQSALCWSSLWTSFRVYHRSATEAADDLILKLGNILYNPFPFCLNCNQGLVSILWQICPPVVGRLIPRSAKISLIGSQCAITELSPVNSSQKSPDHLSYKSKKWFLSVASSHY